MKVVGNDAFYGCTQLKSVRLYDKLETIGDYAFGNEYDEETAQETANASEEELSAIANGQAEAPEIDKLVDDISLHDALNKLPAEDRELILLRYINNEPLSVISAIYGISRFALSRKLKRILSALRNELGKEGTV